MDEDEVLEPLPIIPADELAKHVKADVTRRIAELEEAVGRKLNEDEVKVLKRARREGDYHEKLVDMRTSGKHDKFG